MQTMKRTKQRCRADPFRNPIAPTWVDGILKCRFEIQKSDDDDEHLVFGWANIATRADGEVIQDWQDDIVEIDELERAVYDYVLQFRDAGEMHERGGIGTLVESMVFTKRKMEALGIPEGTVPEGWWIGFKITDEGVWQKIKDGTYQMFSIEGSAVRERVDDV